VETAFLLLVTVSTVNLLTTVLNDAPIQPEDEEDNTASLLKDSPQCVTFGLFMIWFSSITINLGPTFLSGALAANADAHIHEPSCPLVQGPYRHYILNALWILINLLCVMLTLYQLRRLYNDFTTRNLEAVRIAGLFTTMINITEKATVPPTSNIKQYIERMEREGVARVKMFLVITVAYLIFWGPLFLVTLVNWSWEWKDAKKSMSHEVSLHVAFVHSFVNPLLFVVLHKGCRAATLDLLCCNFSQNRGREMPPEVPAKHDTSFPSELSSEVEFEVEKAKELQKRAIASSKSHMQNGNGSNGFKRGVETIL